MNTNTPKRTFPFTIGLEITKLENGLCHGELRLNEDHQNSTGRAHGGVLCTIADSLCGAAVISKLSGDLFPATTDFHMSFLKSAKGDIIQGTADVIHLGSRTASVECSLFSDDILIARATATFMIISRNK